MQPPDPPHGLDACATAGELAAAVAARQVGALELCDAAIRRIEAEDGAINVVVVRDFERARAQARERDLSRSRGAGGPLLGVPMTVKESFNVAGLPTSWGMAPFRRHVPQTDATLVARLRGAGAIILGKTNVAEALADWQSDNPVYGRTLNPHDPARTPGGSSGGGAAALASGLVSLELGSDIGGSIRVPAHFCGVFGHKPSFGLLPMRGHDFPGADAMPVPLAVAGPLARTASDLALAMSVLAGPDDEDAVAYRVELPPPRHEALSGCRVLLLDAHPCCATDAGIRDALTALGGRLADAGARVERRSAMLPDLEAGQGTYQALLETINSRGAPGAAPPIDAHVWMALLDERDRVRRQWRRLFAEAADIVLMPPFGTAAFEHQTDPDFDRRLLTVDGRPQPYAQQLAWPGIASLAGLPVTVAPIGETASGLPIGVQIMGPWLEDRTTLAFAGALEAAGWARARTASPLQGAEGLKRGATAAGRAR